LGVVNSGEDVHPFLGGFGEVLHEDTVHEAEGGSTNVMVGVPFVHQTGTVLGVVSVFCLVVKLEELSLVKVECSGYLSGPVLNNLVKAHILGSEDVVLMSKAILHILRELTILAVVTLIKKVWHHQMRDPNLVVVGEGQETVADLHTVLHEVICDVPGHVQELLEDGVQGS